MSPIFAFAIVVAALVLASVALTFALAPPRSDAERRLARAYARRRLYRPPLR